FYDASRKLILKGVDGVVFVADSQEERMDANIESLYNLEENLQANGYDLVKIPYVLQLNKRDLPNIIPPDDMVAELRRKEESADRDKQKPDDFDRSSGFCRIACGCERPAMPSRAFCSDNLLHTSPILQIPLWNRHLRPYS